MEPNSLHAFCTGNLVDVYVPASWRAEEGGTIPGVSGTVIGKRFGAAAMAQNQIFDLLDEASGQSLHLALKVCKPGIAARRSLAHEWKMFSDLGRLGEEAPAARSHFLQAERVLKTKDDTIVGIIMEKANGRNVIKTLKQPGFANVRYCIALIRDLLVALNVAQGALGFAHYDLKLDNIMEHWGCNPDPEAAKTRSLIDSVPQFKLFDFGTAVVYPDPFSVKNVKPTGGSLGHKPEAAEQLAEEKAHGEARRPGRVLDSSKEPEGFEYSEPYCCVRLYHLWWASRGDVYRVLGALARLLDDKTWPIEDLEEVSLLMTVLEHATDAKRMRARFAPRASLYRRLRLPPPPGRASSLAARLASMHSTALGLAPAGTAAAVPAQQQQQQQQQQQGALAGSGAARGPATPPGFSPAAAAPGALPGGRAASSSPSPGPGFTPRRSVDLPGLGSAGGAGSGPALLRTPSGRAISPAGQGALPGVAFTRFEPAAGAASPPTAAAAAAAAAAAEARSPFHASQRGGAAAGSEVQAAGAAAPSSSQADPGCQFDPAAAIVRAASLLPPPEQSVLGSRRALKGVTAAQLLAEPVIQSLLLKV